MDGGRGGSLGFGLASTAFILMFLPFDALQSKAHLWLTLEGSASAPACPQSPFMEQTGRKGCPAGTGAAGRVGGVEVPGKCCSSPRGMGWQGEPGMGLISLWLKLRAGSSHLPGVAVGVKPPCQQQGNTRVMEGGQERMGCEERGEAQCQEPHRSQGALGAVMAEPFPVGVSHSIFGGFWKPLHTEPGDVTFGVNHSRN